MSEFPHELIRQVQICSRAAAGLPDYNPLDPTLPALPSLSAAIAAFEPSPPELRCNNCKGRLLRGLDSTICLYCGQAPQNDAVPDPICFTSTLGYQWLLRSLNLSGSEMVEPLTNESKQDLGQSSPKSLTPLSDFLDFKIPCQHEIEKQEINLSDKHSQESVRHFSLTAVAPDDFLFKSKRDVQSDTPNEQPFIHSHTATAGTKDITAVDNQNLFQNNQSSELAENSNKGKISEAFSGWEADFQWADSGEQHISDESFGHFTGPTPDFDNKIEDSQSFDDPGSQSFGHFTGPTPGYDNKIEDSQSFDDLGSQSFGHFTGPTPGYDNKIEDSQSFDDPDSQSFGRFTGPTPENKISGSQSFDNPESQPFGLFMGPTSDFENKIEDSQPFGLFTGPAPVSGNKIEDSQSFDNFDSQPFGLFTGPAPDSEKKTNDTQSFDNSDFHSFGLFTGPASDSGNKVKDFQSVDNPDPGNKFWDSQSVDHSKGLEVDLASHFDSVFGPGKDPIYEKPRENPEASPPFDNWNSDDVWTNLSNGSNFAKANDATATISGNNGNTLDHSNELSSGADLFQDFQRQTDNADMTENKMTNEDSFGEWNDFTGSTSLQMPSSSEWIGSDYRVSTSDKKSTEMDLFGLDSKFEETGFGDFSQSNMFSTSTSNENVVTEGGGVSSENSALNWLSDASNPSFESGLASNIGDSVDESTEAKDDVKMLISQMHDLSFMLEKDLCIPSTSNAHNTSLKD